jgi:hypothetical protein
MNCQPVAGTAVKTVLDPELKMAKQSKLIKSQLMSSPPLPGGWAVTVPDSGLPLFVTERVCTVGEIGSKLASQVLLASISTEIVGVVPVRQLLQLTNRQPVAGTAVKTVLDPELKMAEQSKLLKLQLMSSPPLPGGWAVTVPDCWLPLFVTKRVYTADGGGVVITTVHRPGSGLALGWVIFTVFVPGVEYVTRNGLMLLAEPGFASESVASQEYGWPTFGRIPVKLTG